MRKKIYLLLLIFIHISLAVKPINNEKRTLEIKRVTAPPKIDGIFNDACWNNAAIAKDFFQYEPYNGRKPSLPSEVRVVYDDYAIYFAATLIDNQPDSILQELSNRDSFDGANADLFAVVINLST